MAFLSLFVVNLSIIAKNYLQSEEMIKKGIWSLEFYVGESQNVSSVVGSDMDLLWENCAQAIMQVCENIVMDCKTNDPVKVWGWALAAVVPPYDVLEENVDYVVVFERPGNLSSLPDVLVDLNNVPNSTSSGDCSPGGLLDKGRYYYKIFAEPLGCNVFKLNLNQLEVGSSPCQYSDILSQ